MKHSYEILNAEIKHDHAGENTDFTEVTVQILLDGEPVGDPRRFGFALDIEEAAIRAELDRVAAALDSDVENTAKSAEYEKKRAAAQETVDALLGKKADKEGQKPSKKADSKKNK